MPQDQLLERDAGPESERSRAESADRACGDLQHPGAAVVESEFSVDRAVGQAQRARRPRRRHVDLRLPLTRKTGGGDVDRLLEEGSVQRVGLVEDGQDLELATTAQPLD